MSTLDDVKHEWRQFRDDEPGKRFGNHRERMHQKSRTHAAVTMALGVLLVAGGIVLLFIPGPGIPLIVFGVALVATHSERLSERLDRVEPRLRDGGQRARSWWSELPVAGKVGLVTCAVLVATALLMATWKWVVAAHLL
jgi:hypothetical protein